jgi:hypothetical protein
MGKLFQAGAIPYRRQGRVLEFLLVTSKGGNWIFPKGIVEPGDSWEEAAAKECREEAGVRGRVVPPEVGSYSVRKWMHECDVSMFILRYEEDIDPWEEQHMRERRWFTYEEAANRLKSDELRAILARAKIRLESEEALA